MFATIAVPSPRTDLDGEALAQYIICAAKCEMSNRQQYRTAAKYLGERGSFLAMNFAYSEADVAFRMAKRIALPLRLATEERTAQEVQQAEWLVKQGKAFFRRPACSDETCAECDRPLWHHIQVMNHGQLCPMGREFWQLARALVLRNDCIMPRCPHETMIREIARP